MRIARVFPVSRYAADEIQKNIVQWFLAVLCIILVTAGIMQAVMLSGTCMSAS